MNFEDPAVRDEEIALELTPLIDMVFQLLIFFLLTTTFAVNVKEGGIEVDLPRAKSAQIPAMSRHVVIAILKDGRMVVGGESMTENALREKLIQVHKENPKTMVVVQADRTVEHGSVVRAMDMAVDVGLKSLAIATVEE